MEDKEFSPTKLWAEIEQFAADKGYKINIQFQPLVTFNPLPKEESKPE